MVIQYKSIDLDTNKEGDHLRSSNVLGPQTNKIFSFGSKTNNYIKRQMFYL